MKNSKNEYEILFSNCFESTQNHTTLISLRQKKLIYLMMHRAQFSFGVNLWGHLRLSLQVLLLYFQGILGKTPFLFSSVRMSNSCFSIDKELLRKFSSYFLCQNVPKYQSSSARSNRSLLRKAASCTAVALSENPLVW